jgi:hypothetical protein
MQDFYIGIITTVAIIALVEVLSFLEKRLVGALTLVSIAFIYIGFAWNDTPSLVYAILGTAVFFTLSYFGYQKNFILIVIGLILHGIWDMLFPFISSTAPEGYGVFCLTVDFLLAIYFYIRVKPLKQVQNAHQQTHG